MLISGSNEEIKAHSAVLLNRLAELKQRRAAQAEFEAGMPARTPSIEHDGPERRGSARLDAAIHELRGDLVLLHDRMVMRLARDWCGNRRDLIEECEQAGREGLLEAIDTFDATKGSFSSWAWKVIRRHVAAAKHEASDTPFSAWDRKIEPRIKQAQRAVLARDPQADPTGPAVIAACKAAIPDGVADATVIKILTSARHADISACAPMATDSHDEDVEDSQLIEDIIKAIRRASHLLTAEHLTALVMRHGLDGQPAATFEAIGEAIGVSQRTARKRYDAAIQEVRAEVTRTPAAMF